MTGTTHFIEQFTNKGKLMQGVLCDIKDLQRNLKITAGSPDLKTIAVWKIKFKPGYDDPAYSVNDIPDSVG